MNACFFIKYTKTTTICRCKVAFILLCINGYQTVALKQILTKIFTAKYILANTYILLKYMDILDYIVQDFLFTRFKSEISCFCDFLFKDPKLVVNI